MLLETQFEGLGSHGFHEENVRDLESAGPGLSDDLGGVLSVADDLIALHDDPMTRECSQFRLVSASPGQLAASRLRRAAELPWLEG